MYSEYQSDIVERILTRKVFSFRTLISYKPAVVAIVLLSYVNSQSLQIFWQLSY